MLFYKKKSSLPFAANATTAWALPDIDWGNDSEATIPKIEIGPNSEAPRTKATVDNNT